MVEDKIDESDIILEVTAGAGGQEAMLFALEIFNMYACHAAHRGWEFTELDRNTGESGKRVCMKIFHFCKLTNLEQC